MYIDWVTNETLPKQAIVTFMGAYIKYPLTSIVSNMFSYTSCDSEILETGTLSRDMNPAKTDTGYSQSFGSEMKLSDAGVSCRKWNVNDSSLGTGSITFNLGSTATSTNPVYTPGMDYKSECRGFVRYKLQ